MDLSTLNSSVWPFLTCLAPLIVIILVSLASNLRRYDRELAMGFFIQASIGLGGLAVIFTAVFVVCPPEWRDQLLAVVYALASLGMLAYLLLRSRRLLDSHTLLDFGLRDAALPIVLAGVFYIFIALPNFAQLVPWEFSLSETLACLATASFGALWIAVGLCRSRVTEKGIHYGLRYLEWPNIRRYFWQRYFSRDGKEQYELIVELEKALPGFKYCVMKVPVGNVDTMKAFLERYVVLQGG